MQFQGVGACLKHFACNTQETDRLPVSADVDDRGLREIYLRAFELTIWASQQVELPIARTDLEHFHPAAGWVFAGGQLEVSVGSSSRDIRLQAPVEVPGHPVELPLTVWSQLGEWMSDPAVGPALRELIEERGGIKGRVGDLLSDPVSKDSALIFPLISVTQFPGFPISTEEAEELLHQL